MRYLTSGNAHGGNAGAMRYYTASGEPPGRWAGKGAAALGLSGTVDGKVMDRLYMEHVGPGGDRLTRPRGNARDDNQVEAAVRSAHPFWSEVEVAKAVAKARAGKQTSVPYYDLTVSAAKSVSVLHASLKIAAQDAYNRGDRVTAGRLNARRTGSRRTWRPRRGSRWSGRKPKPAIPGPGTTRLPRGSGGTGPG